MSQLNDAMAVFESEGEVQLCLIADNGEVYSTVHATVHVVSSQMHHHVCPYPLLPQRVF